MQRFRAHLTESLFLDTPPGRSRFKRWETVLLVAALLALAVVLQLARLGWSTSLNSLWAEDGPIYMQEALTHSFWHAITGTYATYLVVVPRLIAEVASLAPLRDVPAAVSILSAGVVGLSGLAVWQASAAHIRNPYLRGTLAALTVLTPVAGLESIDSAAYVPWYMLFATFWILLWRPATTRGTVFASAFVVLTGLSTPGVWFFAPLAVLRALAARDRRDIAILAFYGLGAAIQIPVIALTKETAVTPIWTHDIWTTYLQRIIDGAPLGLRLGGNAWVQFGWPLLIVLAIVFIVGLIAGFRSSNTGARWIAGLAVPISAVMFIVSLYQRAVGEQMVWAEGLYNGSGSRYAIVPALLLVSAVVVLLDGATRQRPASRRLAWGSAATVAVLGLALVTSFWARDLSVRGVPPWDAALEGAAKECTAKGAEESAIQTSPPGWAMQLPCDRIASFAPRQ